MRAHGGARKAAATARAGRAATAALGGFLSSVARAGVADTLRVDRYRDLVGKTAVELQRALTEMFSPAGASREDAAARSAVAAVVADLYERYDLEERGLEGLAALSEGDVRAAVTEMVAQYVYYRWLEELGKVIERGSISEKEAVSLEAEMRDYVRATVQLDLKDVDVLRVDWQGQDGRQVTEAAFQQAYQILEEQKA